MTRRERRGEPLSLVLFDIDHFKSINDRFGHLSGDQVLVQLCQLVRAQLRATDVFARWGGEGFVVLLPRCPAGDARRLAEQLRVLIAAYPFADVGSVTMRMAAYLPWPDVSSNLELLGRVCTDASAPG